MNFNNAKKKFSPTQLMKGSEGDDENRWGSRLGLAEDGISKAKRPVAPVHVLTAAMYSHRHLPDRVQHLESGQPRFNLGRRRENEWSW